MTTAKVSRALKLNPEVDARLVRLCEHLGVSIHSYLLNELGKAISRDEISLMAKDRTTEMTSALQTMLMSMED